MKKLFILLMLLSIILFGCVPIDTNEDPIIEEPDDTEEEPIIEEPVDPWETFNDYLVNYQVKLTTAATLKNHNWVERNQLNRYDKMSFDAVYEQMSSNNEARQDEIVPFLNIINTFIGYIDDGLITGFNEIYEINPADFGAVLVIMTFYENGDIFAHLVKESIFNSALYESYHFSINQDKITIESISTTISENSKPNFRYYQWVEDDYNYTLDYSENNYLSYEYYDLKSPDLYRIYFDDNDFKFVTWYEEETQVEHHLSMSWESEWMPSFSLIGEHGFYFIFETYETSSALMWQMMETDGWDYLHDANLNVGQATESTGIYKNSTKLFTSVDNVFYNTGLSDIHANLLVKMYFDDLNVTDGLLNLSDFGLSFKDERLNKIFFDEQVDISLTKGQNNFIHQSFDFRDEDMVENFLNGLNSEFIPDELMMWFN